MAKTKWPRLLSLALVLALVLSTGLFSAIAEEPPEGAPSGSAVEDGGTNLDDDDEEEELNEEDDDDELELEEEAKKQDDDDDSKTNAGGDDFAIDPETGYRIDPETGLLIDPETGYLIDAETGLLIDPDTGWLIDEETGWPIDPETGVPVAPVAAAAAFVFTSGRVPMPAESYGNLPGSLPAGTYYLYADHIEDEDATVAYALSATSRLQFAADDTTLVLSGDETIVLARIAVGSASSPTNSYNGLLTIMTDEGDSRTLELTGRVGNLGTPRAALFSNALIVKSGVHLDVTRADDESKPDNQNLSTRGILVWGKEAGYVTLESGASVNTNGLRLYSTAIEKATLTVEAGAYLRSYFHNEMTIEVQGDAHIDGVVELENVQGISRQYNADGSLKSEKVTYPTNGFRVLGTLEVNGQVRVTGETASSAYGIEVGANSSTLYDAPYRLHIAPGASVDVETNYGGVQVQRGNVFIEGDLHIVSTLTNGLMLGANDSTLGDVLIASGANVTIEAPYINDAGNSGGVGIWVTATNFENDAAFAVQGALKVTAVSSAILIQSAQLPLVVSSGGQIEAISEIAPAIRAGGLVSASGAQSQIYALTSYNSAYSGAIYTNDTVYASDGASIVGEAPYIGVWSGSGNDAITAVNGALIHGIGYSRTYVGYSASPEVIGPTGAVSAYFGTIRAAEGGTIREQYVYNPHETVDNTLDAPLVKPYAVDGTTPGPNMEDVLAYSWGWDEEPNHAEWLGREDPSVLPWTIGDLSLTGIPTDSNGLAPTESASDVILVASRTGNAGGEPVELDIDGIHEIIMPADITAKNSGGGPDPNRIRVIFHRNDGSENDIYRIQRRQPGGKATKPDPDPARDGHSFTGWYTQADGDERFDFDTLIYTDTHVYAHWSKDDGPPPTTSYTVYFHWNDGEDDDIYFKHGVTSGGKATPSPEGDPGRDGYTFTGWYTKADGDERFDFDTLIYADTHIYAHWTQNDNSGGDGGGGDGGGDGGGGDRQRPGGSTGDGGGSTVTTPNVIISDPAVPLADIPDEEVPLEELPFTGMVGGGSGLAAAVFAGTSGVYALKRRGRPNNA